MPPHRLPSNYSRNAHRWCAVIGKPRSAQLESTATMVPELQDIRTHMKIDKSEIEQNTHP